MEYKDPGRYIPIIFLLYSWGSLLGVSNKVPLNITQGEVFRVGRVCGYKVQVVRSKL